MNAAHADLVERMLPTAEQIAAAVAALTEARTEFAIVPIAFPGKDHGVWTVGQPVEHPAGVFACNNDHSFGAASLAAEHAAAVALGERPGTVGYSVVYSDGHAAVFESILSPVKIMMLATKGTT